VIERSNILVIFNDDHAQWAMGAYGNRELKTPTLDYLAETGVLMENAFTPIPVCSPARACFLTGRLASQHGVHDYLAFSDAEASRRWWLKDETTLAEILAATGYETAMCGKWHLGNDVTPQAGFDYWFSLGGKFPINRNGPYPYSDNGVVQEQSGYKTNIIVDKAIQFLRQRDEDRPFFLMVNFRATHAPMKDHPERSVAAYRQCTFEDIPADAMYPFGRQVLESTATTRNNPREALAQYYASVSRIDEATGRLIDELEALGLREDTLVVYTSDHGLCCGHHGIWGKGNATYPLNMVEESIRVPLIFNQPGKLFGGQRRREMVDHLDLFQTLVSSAQIELSKEKYDFPGNNFFPLLNNSDALPDWRNVQFGEYGNLRMIRTRTHKLIRRYPGGPNELFDLVVDPRETNNLFTDPEHQQLVQQLTIQVEEHFSRYADPQKSGLRVRELPRHNYTEAWRLDA
jgi:choline-sulfatase